ncbi:hypothetical protein MMC07_003468 [Pseudocyphellaria aurata]|nr:hypothetical protein [Pseudocyphellaria aurata]
MVSKGSFCALCGLPWFTELKADLQQFAAGASDDESDVEIDIDVLRYSPSNITQADARAHDADLAFYDLPNPPVEDETDNLFYVRLLVRSNLGTCVDGNSGASDTETLYRCTTCAYLKYSQEFCTTQIQV